MLRRAPFIVSSVASEQAGDISLLEPLVACAPSSRFFELIACIATAATDAGCDALRDAPHTAALARRSPSVSRLC